jgi:hypothetical protein
MVVDQLGRESEEDTASIMIDRNYPDLCPDLAFLSTISMKKKISSLTNPKSIKKLGIISTRNKLRNGVRLFVRNSETCKPAKSGKRLSQATSLKEDGA